MRSLLALDYPNLEIIAVDDRSRDETGRILDRLAAADQRLTVIHVSRNIPRAGWESATPYIRRQSSRPAVRCFCLPTETSCLLPRHCGWPSTYLVRRPVDHLCLNPKLVAGGYWENALVACFGLLFFAAFKPWLIPTRWPGAYCGIGAFNLVRRDVYWAVGGHERIRLDVLDDVNLGKLLKQNGYRQELLLEGDFDPECGWQNSFWGVIKGLEKNSFAAVHYSVAELIGVTLLFLIVFFGPYVGAGIGISVWNDSRMIPYLLTVTLLHDIHEHRQHPNGGRRGDRPGPSGDLSDVHSADVALGGHHPQARGHSLARYVLSPCGSASKSVAITQSDTSSRTAPVNRRNNQRPKTQLPSLARRAGGRGREVAR